jgi:hypothetical protein
MVCSENRQPMLSCFIVELLVRPRRWLAIGLLGAMAALACHGAFASDFRQETDHPPRLPPLYIPQADEEAAIIVDVAESGIDPARDPWCQRYGGCSTCITPARLPCWPRWFASATGLVMTRSLPDGATSNGPGGLNVSTHSASASWPGGVDLRLGRWFGDEQQHAVELIYWGVYNIGSTAPQQTGAASGALARSDLVNDVEVNWLYSLGDRPEFHRDTRRLNWMWLAGFRFFQLQDELVLKANPGDIDFDVTTNNNLFGGQMGGRFDWSFAPSMRFVIVPKFLLAGNSISNLAVSSTGGTPTADVRSTLGVFSWLGSVDTSVAWDITERWSLWLGYRVVGVGNIAQADGQWPATIPASAASLSGVAAGSESIIHGGFAGFESRY